MTTEEVHHIGLQILLWAWEVVRDTLRGWWIMYAVSTILAYHLGV